MRRLAVALLLGALASLALAQDPCQTGSYAPDPNGRSPGLTVRSRKGGHAVSGVHRRPRRVQVRSPAAVAPIGCSRGQRIAHRRVFSPLCQFYYATGGPTTWKVRTNWLVAGTSYCTWYGVACSSNATDNIYDPDNGMTGNLVVKLNLTSNNLGTVQEIATLCIDDASLTQRQWVPSPSRSVSCAV